MYCIKCGVELADTEKRCPLCQTRVYHPDIEQPEAPPMYPEGAYPEARPISKGLQVLLTGVFAIAVVFSALCDLQLNSAFTWSGYVVGALIVVYVSMILPTWFRKANPVIFMPCSFAAVLIYLLYINFATGGNWFMSFAFPVTGGVAILNTALAALLKYVAGGKLYIVGGYLAALGAFMIPLEYWLGAAFPGASTGWSAYPMTALVLVGGFLIFLGICRPAREAMERRFFF